jgi:alkaline phosphatase D
MVTDTKSTGLGRREFAVAAAAMGASLPFSSSAAHASKRSWKERRDLNAQGVASGDPMFDGVILWTRNPPAPGNVASKLAAEVSEDASFQNVVATAFVLPAAENDRTVRVLAAGLKSATTYWHRFIDGRGMGSCIGRTKTAPAEDRAVHFAFLSCQNQNVRANNLCQLSARGIQ